MNYKLLFWMLRLGLILATIGALKLATIFMAGKAALSVQRGVEPLSKLSKALTK